MVDRAIKSYLQAILGKFPAVHAYVVGDAMLDRYTFGTANRICPEAPVPVLVPVSDDERPGGAANVASQLGALGCMVRGNFGPRSVKHRFMVGQRLMLRVDSDVYTVPTQEQVEVAVRELEDGHFTVLVISDYAKGWASHLMCKALIEAARRKRIPVVVDPKSPHWARYAGANVICPNEQEWITVNREWPLGVDAIIVKRGDRGLQVHESKPLATELVYWSEDRTTDIPAHARHVYDVTGAGDTVTAVIAATLGVRGASGKLIAGAHLANLAAAYVVGEVGTTVCPIDELRREVENYNVEVATEETDGSDHPATRPA